MPHPAPINSTAWCGSLLRSGPSRRLQVTWSTSMRATARATRSRRRSAGGRGGRLKHGATSRWSSAAGPLVMSRSSPKSSARLRTRRSGRKQVRKVFEQSRACGDRRPGEDDASACAGVMQNKAAMRGVAQEGYRRGDADGAGGRERHPIHGAAPNTRSRVRITLRRSAERHRRTAEIDVSGNDGQ